MALVGLCIIFIFKCKCHYRSHVIRQIIEKMDDEGLMMDDESFLPMGEFIFLACYMYRTCSKLINSCTSATYGSW